MLQLMPPLLLAGRAYDLAAGSPTSTTLPLSFLYVPGARSYEYSISSTSAVAGFGAWTALASDKIITGLSSSTQYWAKVRIVNGVARGPSSPVVTGTTSAGGGALAFDATNSNNMANSAGTTLTISLTAAAGVTGLGVGLYTYSGSGVTVSSVVWDPTGANQALTKKTNSATISINTNTEVWASDGFTPASGTKNLVITMSGTGGYVDAYIISVTGGNSTTPLSFFSSTTGSSITPTSGTITSASGQIIFDIVGNDSSDASITPNGAQTQRMAPQGTILQAAGSTKPGAASTTTSWTLGGSEAWAMSYGSFQ